jgi:hypothetical protein
MGRRGRARTDIHERVIALYQKGQRPADIARTLKTPIQWVSAILKGAGIDAAADVRKLAREAEPFSGRRGRRPRTWPPQPSGSA